MDGVRVDDRAAYMAALEQASVADQIDVFADFVARCVRGSP